MQRPSGIEHIEQPGLVGLTIGQVTAEQHEPLGVRIPTHRGPLGGGRPGGRQLLPCQLLHVERPQVPEVALAAYPTPQVGHLLLAVDGVGCCGTSPGMRAGKLHPGPRHGLAVEHPRLVAVVALNVHSPEQERPVPRRGVEHRWADDPCRRVADVKVLPDS